MFGVGSLGPRWMPQGSRGAGPLSGSSRRGGHWGRLSIGGSPGPERSPTLRLGKCARAAAAAGLEVARLHASRHPGGRSRTSPTGRGGRSTAWTGGREPRGPVPPPPAGTPAGLGCVAQGFGGAAGPLKWQRDHCVFQPASLQLLGAMEG